MSNFQWFFSDMNGQQQGPVAADVIAAHVGSGTLGMQSMVWRDGLAGWLPLSQVLSDLGMAPAMPPPAPPAAAVPPASFHPAAGAGNTARQAPASVDADAIATFVGANQDIYERKWKAADATGSKHGWHWPAFLLGPVWIIYRKMYRNTAIVIGSYFLLGIMEQMGFPAGAVAGMQLAVVVGVGVFANYAYRQFVQEQVEQITRTTQESALKTELARRGGTNMGGAIGLAAAMFVLILIGIAGETM